MRGYWTRELSFYGAAAGEYLSYSIGFDPLIAHLSEPLICELRG